MAPRHLIFSFFLFTASAYAEPQWFVVQLDGAKVGHAQMQRETAAGRTIDTTLIDIELQGADRPNRIALEQRFESDAGGAPLGWFTQLQTHDVLRRKTVTVDDGTLDVHRNEQGIERRERIALPPGVTWPIVEAAQLREAFARPGSVLAFKGFDTTDDHLVDVELRVGEKRAIDALGHAVEATEVVRTTRNGESRSASTTWLDGDLRPIRVAMRVAGVQLDLVAASREEALAPNATVDFMKRLFVRSPYRIPPLAATQRIRYVLAHDDPAFALPATGEQRAHRKDDAVVLDVCGNCGDEPPIARVPAEALQPSDRIQSDAPEIVAGANTVANIADPRRRMHALAGYVRSHMQGTNGYLGEGSALQAARTGQGDCVTYALYLAALGRAAGIPTRIAGGMVYSDRLAGRGDVFVPHAWTQALIDGRWVSFDAATEGFDSVHVALVVGQGDRAAFANAMGRLATLKLRSVAQVAQRAPGGAR